MNEKKKFKIFYIVQYDHNIKKRLFSVIRFLHKNNRKCLHNKKQSQIEINDSHFKFN